MPTGCSEILLVGDLNDLEYAELYNSHFLAAAARDKWTSAGALYSRPDNGTLHPRRDTFPRRRSTSLGSMVVAQSCCGTKRRPWGHRPAPRHRSVAQEQEVPKPVKQQQQQVQPKDDDSQNKD
ncbi:MAG: hypothetical protein WBM51_25865 [Pseudolabrys sp.]|jgi:hypothetical protein